jgi:hypothetical protein
MCAQTGEDRTLAFALVGEFLAAFSGAEMWLDFIIIRTVFCERPDGGRCLLAHVPFASKCGIIRTLVEYFNRSDRGERMDAEPVLTFSD